MMKYDPDKHKRRSLRLKGYDYASPGAYFITICTQNRACLFSEISAGMVILNDAGAMIQRVWNELPQRFSHIDLDAFVVMPNHVHGIIQLTGEPNAIANAGVGAGTRLDPAVDGENSGGMPIVGTLPGNSGDNRGLILGNIVGAFKSITTHQYTIGVKQQNWEPFSQRLWQRNYYEQIIRDPDAFHKIAAYIQTNPQRW